MCLTSIISSMLNLIKGGSLKNKIEMSERMLFATLKLLKLLFFYDVLAIIQIFIYENKPS